MSWNFRVSYKAIYSRYIVVTLTQCGTSSNGLNKIVLINKSGAVFGTDRNIVTSKNETGRQFARKTVPNVKMVIYGWCREVLAGIQTVHCGREWIIYVTVSYMKKFLGPIIGYPTHRWSFFTCGFVTTLVHVVSFSQQTVFVLLLKPNYRMYELGSK